MKKVLHDILDKCYIFLNEKNAVFLFCFFSLISFCSQEYLKKKESKENG